MPSGDGGRVMRMLVVDDEADIANMLAEYFRMEGYEVTAANDGPTALRRSHRAPFRTSCCSM